MQRFKNKIVLVTASSSGIGLAIAERIATEGGIVLINSRKEEHVKDAVEKIIKSGGRAYPFVGDLTDKKNRETLVDRLEKEFQKLDVLILNHAASFQMGPTLLAKENDINKMIDTNLKSYLTIIKDTYELLFKARGNIVITSSKAGLAPNPNLGIYCITKTALLGMVKLFAKEFQNDEIRVNGVAPGIIKTKFAEPLWKDENVAQRNLKEAHINRFGEPSEVASVVAFLASDDASYVNGEIIAVMGSPSPRL